MSHYHITKNINTSDHTRDNISLNTIFQVLSKKANVVLLGMV